MRFLPALNRVLLTLGVAAAVSGCNLNKLTANTTSGMLEFGSVAMDREADVEFARHAFPASLKTLETFLVSSPENESLLLLVARGYNSYAFGILEGDLERVTVEGGTDEEIEALTRRAMLHYLRGSAYGFRLLGDDELEEAARSGDLEVLDARLAAVKPKQLPALFWAGYGWASAINLAKDDPELVAGLSAVERIMARAYELDPGYNAGAPILFHGVLHASKPVVFGGQPEEAKRYFDEAMREHGEENLLVPFLYGRFYCVQVQDKQCFTDLMARVHEADLTAHPDLRLTNEIARERARFWSKHVDDIILGET
jgi:hypothetical protein